MTTQAKATAAKKTTAAKTTQPETPKPQLQPLREIWTPRVVQLTVRTAATDIAVAVAAVVIVKHMASFTNVTLRSVIQEAMYRKMWKK